MDEIFKLVVFLHVLGAIVWLGSAGVMELLEYEAVHATKRDRVRTVLHRGVWFGKRVFGPSSLFTVLTGIIAVIIGRPEFGQLWVILALIGVVCAFVIGGMLISFASMKLYDLLEVQGMHEDEVEKGLLSVKTYSHIDLAILIFVLFDMVMRPTNFDPVFVSIVIAYIVVVAIAIALSARRPTPTVLTTS